MVHVAKRYSGRCPTHPGALLREDMIPATGRTIAEIAQLLGISRQHLYDILRERGVSCRGGSARQIVRRWRRNLGTHAGRIRYMECRTQRGCQQIPRLRVKAA
jgi:AraC-like DNA-binding protein